jgi:60 kDa SS-A/Ro ribonucleoprotein
MRLNTHRTKAARTHEGAPVIATLSALQQLRRSVLSCLLWEDELYEDGQSIAERIIANAMRVTPRVLAALAIEAREVFNLRHVPLLLLEVLSRTGKGERLVADTVARVVQRADEPGELVALHHRLGAKRMLPAQMRKGLARAIAKFDEYEFAKYDRDSAVKLRDVLRLVRPTPKDEAQSALWKRVKERTLAMPDTWEVALSGGADKRATFERLLCERKLGYVALLRNLRNMVQAGVDVDLLRQAIVARKGGAQRVLPFRYVAAARAAPQLEPSLDQALCAAIAEMPALRGKTIVLVDVSGSMTSRMSRKSDLTRMDAAATLGAIVPGDLRLFHVLERPRRGSAAAGHGGRRRGRAVAAPRQHQPRVRRGQDQRAGARPADRGHGRAVARPCPGAGGQTRLHDQRRFLPERRRLWPLDPHRRVLGGCAAVHP